MSGSGEYLPMIGTLKISYARLIQLLLQKRVKRVYLLADGQVAIVEASIRSLGILSQQHPGAI